MLVETKARVGVFAIALGAYLPQFPTLVPEFEGQYAAFKKTLPDTVDVQLREFVMSMLAKDPLDRPKDALVVSRTLSRIERRLLDQQTQLADTMVVSSGGRLPRRVVSKPHISVSNDWKEQG